MFVKNPCVISFKIFCNVGIFHFLLFCLNENKNVSLMCFEGGKLVYQSTKKRASGPKCPVTGKRIQGVCILV